MFQSLEIVIHFKKGKEQIKGMDIESIKAEDYSLNFGITVATSESIGASSGAASFVRITFNGNEKSSKGCKPSHPSAAANNSLLPSPYTSSLTSGASNSSKETQEELQGKKISMGIELGIKEIYELIASLRNSLSDSINE